MRERSALPRRPARSSPRPGLRGAAHPFAPQRRSMGPPPPGRPRSPAPAGPPPLCHARPGAARPYCGGAGSSPNTGRSRRRPPALGRADPRAPTRWRGARGTWLPDARGGAGARGREARGSVGQARREAPGAPARPAAPGGAASLSPRALAALSAGRRAQPGPPGRTDPPALKEPRLQGSKPPALFKK